MRYIIIDDTNGKLLGDTLDEAQKDHLLKLYTADGYKPTVRVLQDRQALATDSDGRWVQRYSHKGLDYYGWIGGKA